MRDLRWFLIGFLLGFLLVFLPKAHGQGLDTLALQLSRFSSRPLAERIRPGYIGGNLDWTFGSSLAPLRRMLATGNVAVWRTHIFNGPCLRNRNCGRYEPHAGRTVEGFNAAWERGGKGRLRRHLVARVRLYCELFAAHPTTLLYLSPTLEHNLSRKAFRQQSLVVAEHCPAAFIVDNPVGGVPTTRGFVTERHGRKLRLKAPCIVSLDGEVENVNYRRFLSDHPQCLAYLWTLELNCRRVGPFEDPRARTNCPTVSHLEWLLSLLPSPEL